MAGFAQEPIGFGQEPEENDLGQLIAAPPEPVVSYENSIRLYTEKMEEVKQFMKKFPPMEENYKKLLSLEFFALCPNGKRIPVHRLCEEYEKDPDGLAYRSVDDRLILVLQAMFPGEETPYWQQAFYRSTGTSSEMPTTWLPFNGIAIDDFYLRKVRNRNSYQPRERTKNEMTLYSDPWFAKAEFVAPKERMFPRLPYMNTLEDLKVKALHSYFGTLFLPESNLLYVKSAFDRFGTLSYLLASQAMGGNFFTGKRGYFASFLSLEDEKLQTLYEEKLDTLSPEKPCFQPMTQTYPIVKPNIVNKYIDKYKAVSFMNAFRPYNLFPPGLEFLLVPQKNLGYALPTKGYLEDMNHQIKNFFILFHLGEKSLDDIRTAFSQPNQYVKNKLSRSRKDWVQLNEPEFTFTVPAETLAHYRKYLGGKSRHKQRKQKRKTMKRKERQA